MNKTNGLRVIIQDKLNPIGDLDCGVIVGDDMIEEHKYYFGYKLSTVGIRHNLDYSNKSETYILTGYLSTKGGSLADLDKFTDQIVDKLEELRFLVSTNDISTLDTTVRKVLITGSVKYDYLDGLLK